MGVTCVIRPSSPMSTTWCEDCGGTASRAASALLARNRSTMSGSGALVSTSAELARNIGSSSTNRRTRRSRSPIGELSPVSTNVTRQSEMSLLNSWTSRAPFCSTKSFDLVSS